MYRITPARSTPTKALGTASRSPTKSASCCPCAKSRDGGSSLVERIYSPVFRTETKNSNVVHQLCGRTPSPRQCPRWRCGEHHSATNMMVSDTTDAPTELTHMTQILSL